MALGHGGVVYGTLSTLVSFFAKAVGVEETKAEMIGSTVGTAVGSLAATVVPDPVGVAVIFAGHTQKLAKYKAKYPHP